MPKKFDDKTIKHAHAIWEVMQREAKNHGLALIKHPNYGDGRVMVNTVGAFINAFNRERNWGLDDAGKDIVRRYLKASGNVVVLEKVEQYRYRIFVREEWSNAALAPVPVVAGTSKTEQQKRAEAKVTEKEAGEDREPAPVQFKCAECGKSYDSQNALNAHKAAHKGEPKKTFATPRARSQPLGEQQEAILIALSEMGGEASHPHGRASHVVWEQNPKVISKGSVGSSIKALTDRGMVMKDGNLRRTYKVSLTREGWKAVEKLTGQKHEESETITDLTPALKSRELMDETVKGIVAELDQMSDEMLISILKRRLTKPKQDEKMAKELDETKQKVALIGSLVDDVMEGKTAPLMALAEIAEAVKL